MTYTIAILIFVVGIFLGCVLSHIQQRLLEDKRRGADFDRAARGEKAKAGPGDPTEIADAAYLGWKPKEAK